MALPVAMKFRPLLGLRGLLSVYIIRSTRRAGQFIKTAGVLAIVLMNGAPVASVCIGKGANRWHERSIYKCGGRVGQRKKGDLFRDGEYSRQSMGAQKGHRENRTPRKDPAFSVRRDNTSFSPRSLGCTSPPILACNRKTRLPPREVSSYGYKAQV